MSDSEQVKKRRSEIYWEGDQLICVMRNGTMYKFEEQTGGIIEEAARSATVRRTERGQVVEELKENLMFNKLICKSCVEPVLKESEFEINKLKGSETVALKKAMLELYDIESFLN
jgi:hypothetical protein